VLLRARLSEQRSRKGPNGDATLFRGGYHPIPYRQVAEPGDAQVTIFQLWKHTHIVDLDAA
jgi:hypothetical protein